jgi:hypothetical protein
MLDAEIASLSETWAAIVPTCAEVAIADGSSAGPVAAVSTTLGDMADDG